MERMTVKCNDGVVRLSANATCDTAIDRLAAYEETELTPEEIKNLKTGVIPAHWGELFKAECDGRLVVLPCKVGDTVWAAGSKRFVECYVKEVYIDDNNNIEYLVLFDCNNDCEGCPFASWHQDYSGEYSCDAEYGYCSISFTDFGNTVFLTREAAEAALKERGLE